MWIKKWNDKEKRVWLQSKQFNLQAPFSLWLFPRDDHFMALQTNASVALLCESLLWGLHVFWESVTHTIKCIHNEMFFAHVLFSRKSDAYWCIFIYVIYKAYSHFFKWTGLWKRHRVSIHTLCLSSVAKPAGKHFHLHALAAYCHGAQRSSGIAEYRRICN